jgi:hypothetical protein
MESIFVGSFVYSLELPFFREDSNLLVGNMLVNDIAW